MAKQRMKPIALLLIKRLIKQRIIEYGCKPKNFSSKELNKACEVLFTIKRAVWMRKARLYLLANEIVEA
jgi:hypothetical protein